MATITGWNPFGVSINITANPGAVTRISASQFRVVVNASWVVYWSGNATNFGIEVTGGGGSATLNPHGNYAGSGSGSFTGTYSISGNGGGAVTVTVVFRKFNNYTGQSATYHVSFSVNVPAWTSYTVYFNANGGSGAPGSQTKWKDQTLTLSSGVPTRYGYTFQGWGTSAGDTTVDYWAGSSYTSNSSITLYAIWKANTFTVYFNANGGSGGPGSQVKTYGVNLTLSSVRPTRTNYNFVGWGVSSGSTSVAYNPGSTYSANASITLYAIWSWAYTKPRIWSYSATRCDSSGTAQSGGPYVKVSFSWSVDQPNANITIYWKSSTSSSYSSNWSISSGSSSGSINQIVGGGSLNSETTYDIQIVVADRSGSTTIYITVPSIEYAFDIKQGGNGIAFGKVAEKNDYAEFNRVVEFYKDVIVHANGTTYNLGTQLAKTISSLSLDENSENTTDNPDALLELLDEELTRIENQIVETMTWRKIDSVSNGETKNITIKNIESYNEFLITVGDIIDGEKSVRVLASTTIPYTKFISVNADYQNGTYIARCGDYGGGVSYLGKNEIKLYSLNDSHLELWVR